MSTSPLFEPYQLGRISLSNRVVMGPLTRNRAGAGLIPSPFAAEYYAQRASAGLIIAEATQISPQAQGYQDTPGIYSDAQIAGWREVTDAVHDRGGKIFLQIWHVGRVSHTSLQPNGAAPVGPSAIKAETQTYINGAFADVSEPRALRLEELPTILDDFRRAAANTVVAGFDGVEVHGANGYLLDQFAKDGSNRRDDAYGGSIKNRARMLLSAVAAVTTEIGADRTGVRISPVTPANGAFTSDPQPLFEHIVSELDAMAPAYLHVIEGATGGPRDFAPFDYGSLRRRFRNTYIANNGYDRPLAEAALTDGAADLIAFGRDYIANPDLVERLKTGAPLATFNQSTLYGGGREGYADYPSAT